MPAATATDEFVHCVDVKRTKFIIETQVRIDDSIPV